MSSLKEKSIPLSPSKVDDAIVKEALLRISQKEFPSRRSEDWRYAKLGKILNQEYLPLQNSEVDISQFKLEGFDGNIIVLVNGIHVPELSYVKDQEGVVIESILESKDEVFKEEFNRLASDNDEIFTDINTAYAQGGIFIKVSKNVQLEKPIYIKNINVGKNVINSARNLVVLESGAEAKIIQGYFSEKDSQVFNNSLSEFVVGANAKLYVDKIQDFGIECKHICTEEVYQEKDSTFLINTHMLSGQFIRNGVNIQVDGTNCHSEMNGLFLAKGDQFVDNHTRVDHLKSNCTSSELYKGILKDKSIGVFNGKVIVHKDAQVIEAYQQNNNIIIDDTAVMNTKPELEIFADDVRCSHGTTTGQFDEEAIFYLQARGVSKNAAKEMLIGAFAEEVLEKIEIEAVRNYVESKM